MLQRILFTFFIAIFFLNLNAQNLFTYGNNTTTVQEFLRAYNKNKTNNTETKEKSVREYLDLYTNFKLKVKAAQELKLDTLAQLKYEVKNFREQIIDNYLIDTKSMQVLIDEAALRGKNDISVNYFFIPKTDSIESEKIANKIVSHLKTENVKLNASVANSFSTNKTRVEYKEVGFVPVFGVKYNFENAIYNTGIGGLSNIVNSDKGYYIFLPTAQRPGIGKWNIAQILLLFPPNADITTKNKIKHKADSVYNLLNKGLAFDAAAKQFSEDRASAEAGGVMAEFGAGKYKDDFEKNIILLKTDNEISKPFETTYGIHIVKRISNKTAPVNIKDYAYQAELKQMILQDSRIEKERIAFSKNSTAITGFKKSIFSEKEFNLPIDSLSKNAVAKVDKLSIAKKSIVTFADGSKVLGKDWINFLKTFYENIEHVTKSKKELANDFFTTKITEKYKANLEKYNEEFKFQMQEFKEGNMLFEIMERNVWGKASIDSIALSNYYQANKQKYMWEESADIVTYNCTNETVAKLALADFKNALDANSIISKSKNSIQTDSSRYELQQLVNIDLKNKPALNSFSDITVNADGTASFVQFKKYYPANITRTFTEARGLVINDYQTVLEKNWVDSLKKIYPVKVNEIEINKLVK